VISMVGHAVMARSKTLLGIHVQTERAVSAQALKVLLFYIICYIMSLSLNSRHLGNIQNLETELDLRIS
jgi:hypothetical protein